MPIIILGGIPLSQLTLITSLPFVHTACRVPINGSDGAKKLPKLEHLELYEVWGVGGHFDPLLLIWPKKAGR